MSLSWGHGLYYGLPAETKRWREERFSTIHSFWREASRKIQTDPKQDPARPPAGQAEERRKILRKLPAKTIGRSCSRAVMVMDDGRPKPKPKDNSMVRIVGLGDSDTFT
jgi:hypothetical protein